MGAESTLGEGLTTPTDTKVSVADSWVISAESDMTAAFGEITNSGADSVTVLYASTNAAATVEFHETVENDRGETIMRPIEGDFVVPSQESRSLEPGGDHLMLMDLTKPLQSGEEVAITLNLSDGTSIEFIAVVKDFAGSDETYEDDTMGEDE